ncbi:MAG: hypothetical protein CMH11_04285 [Maritimibacter sp.]|nr:hypothetical protein [Maritimibacter sp.]
MCEARPGTSDSQCACATDALRADVGAEALALYDAVADEAASARAGGIRRREAWDEGIVAVATSRGVGITDLLNRMNSVGRAHRVAIDGCA